MVLQFQHYSFDQLSMPLLYSILRVRQEVFVVEQDCPYLDADNKDQASFHLVGTDDIGDIVAYTRLLPTGISYPDYCSIGRVLTTKKARGLGTGKKLMWHSIDVCKTLFPGYQIKISAQSHLDKFYTDLGFVATGETYLEDDIPHMAMIYSKV